MKKVLIGVTTLIAVLGIAVGVYLAQQQQDIREQAAPATVLILNPEDTSLNVGETIRVFVDIQPNTNAVTGVTMDIDYDPSLLSIDTNSIQPGNFFGNVNEAEKIVDPVSGNILYTLFASTGTVPPTGNGRVAILTFEAISAGTADITFNFIPGSTTEGSQVTDQAEPLVNVLQSVQNTSVTVSQVSQPTATPTSSANPTATPTSPANPTATPTDNPQVTPTATPTSSPGTGGTSPTITPTPTATSAANKGGATATPMPQLPESGVSTPTLVVIVAGMLLITSSFAFLLVDRKRL